MPNFMHLAKLKNNRQTRLNNLKFRWCSWVKLKYAFYTFVVLFLVFYLVQVNSLATKGYVITELENKSKDLEKENSLLQSKILALQTQEGIKDKLDNLGMVATRQVKYLQNQPPKVAYK